LAIGSLAKFGIWDALEKEKGREFVDAVFEGADLAEELREIVFRKEKNKTRYPHQRSKQNSRSNLQ